MLAEHSDKALLPKGENLAETSSPAMGRPPPRPFHMTGQRLNKAPLVADSQDIIGSRTWGLVEMADASGRVVGVKVTQTAAEEDLNMLRVAWEWEAEGTSRSVELRHGRRSGIRKIYVDKEQIDRQKSVKMLFADTGSTHQFNVGDFRAEITIQPKGVTGFTYQLTIAGNPIEHNKAVPPSGKPLYIGTRALQLKKGAFGLGLTCRKNPQETGIVVWSLQDRESAALGGLLVGDVILSVEKTLLHGVEPLTKCVREATGVVNLEVAGSAPSRIVTVVKDGCRPMGITLQVCESGVGLLVGQVEPAGCVARSGELRMGDIVLAVNDTVPSSPKHAVELIKGSANKVCFNVLVSG